MRIKNVGKCTIVFKGGQLLVGKVAVFKGADAKSIGNALLKAYPNNLEDLDRIKEEDIVDVEISDSEAKPEAKPVEKPKSKKEISDSEAKPEAKPVAKPKSKKEK